MGLTAAQIVDNINLITSQIQNLQAPANSINILSGPLFLIGQGPFPTVVVGLTQEINTITSYIQAQEGTSPFTDKADEQKILDAYTTFVRVAQEFLNILIGKAGLLNDLPLVGPPVTQVLRALEGVIDPYAMGLIAATPDLAAPFTDQTNSLDTNLAAAINAYSSST